MTISGEEYAHVSCGCEHGGLLGAYDFYRILFRMIAKNVSLPPYLRQWRRRICAGGANRQALRGRMRLVTPYGVTGRIGRRAGRIGTADSPRPQNIHRFMRMYALR